MVRQVYLLRRGSLYKIGVSACVGARIREVAPGGEYVWAISSCEAFAIERALHRRFADQACGGEWFCLSEGDVRAFCSVTEAETVCDLPIGLQPPAMPRWYNVGFRVNEATRLVLEQLAAEESASLSATVGRLVQEALFVRSLPPSPPT